MQPRDFFSPTTAPLHGADSVPSRRGLSYEDDDGDDDDDDGDDDGDVDNSDDVHRDMHFHQGRWRSGET